MRPHMLQRVSPAASNIVADTERTSATRRGVQARRVRTSEDIRQFFDGIAASYVDRHGAAAELLRYRCDVLNRMLGVCSDDTLLEVACGTGDHLLALAGAARRAIGIDFSPAMVCRASEKASTFTGTDIDLRVDDATTLATLDDDSVDLAFCVGALEHVPDKQAAFAAVHRVPRRGGRFVSLTVNGAYLWHRHIAPLLRYGTRHLESDRFLERSELLQLAVRAGFSRIDVGYWSFIPADDMPRGLSSLLTVADSVGRALGLSSLRGGLRIAAEA